MISAKFSKRQRLLKASDFQAVFSGPQFRVSHKYVLVLARLNYSKEEEKEVARLGLVIPKKHIRLAVERNRIKRLIRESFRVQQHHLSGIDAIVLARRGMDQESNRIIFNMINKQWLTILKKINQVALT
jgi:ribonuclease P protein component